MTAEQLPGMPDSVPTSSPDATAQAPDEGLRPVSPTWATVQQVTGLLWLAPFIAAGVVVWLLPGSVWWGAAVMAAGLILCLPSIALAGPRTRAHGYREDADELVIARGILWRTVTVVPYGRIQFTDISDGPLLRRFGLSSVKPSTASVTADAEIRGLPKTEADALRARLTEKARERMEGL